MGKRRGSKRAKGKPDSETHCTAEVCGSSQAENEHETCWGQHTQECINFAQNEMASISNAWAQDGESGETGFLPGSAAHSHTNTVPPFSTVPFPVPQFPHLCSVGLYIKAAACIFLKKEALKTKPKEGRREWTGKSYQR